LENVIYLVIFNSILVKNNIEFGDKRNKMVGDFLIEFGDG
jgi:hypothetical protein